MIRFLVHDQSVTCDLRFAYGRVAGGSVGGHISDLAVWRDSAIDYVIKATFLRKIYLKDFRSDK